MNTQTLYRPVGPQELALIRESGWRALVFCDGSTRGCAPASLAPGFVALPRWGILARGLRAIYRYTNGVWLVDAVPVEFIEFPEP